jgi:hypothetical protein
MTAACVAAESVSSATARRPRGLPLKQDAGQQVFEFGIGVDDEGVLHSRHSCLSQRQFDRPGPNPLLVHFARIPRH